MQPSPTAKAGFGRRLIISVLVILLLGAVGYNGYRQKAIFNKVADAINLGRVATDAVASYYLGNRKFPATLKEAGEQIVMDGAARASVNPGSGEVIVTFKNTRFTELSGKHIYYKPSVAADNSINWKCGTDDAELRRILKTRCQD